MKFKHIFIILLVTISALFLIGEPGRVSPVMQVMVFLLAGLLFIRHKSILVPAILCGLIWSADGGLILVFLVALPVIDRNIKSLFKFLGTVLLTKLATIPISFYLFFPYGETPLIAIIPDVSLLSFPLMLFLLPALPGIRYRWQKEREGTIQMLLLAAVLLLPPAVKQPFTVGYTFLFHLILIYWASTSITEGLNRLNKKLKEKKLYYGFIGLTILLTVVWPVYHAVLQRTQNPGSRVQAVSWIKGNLEKGATIVMPTELNMDIKPLLNDYHMVLIDFHQLREYSLNMIAGLSDSCYLLTPRWLQYGKEPGTIQSLAVWREAETRITEMVAFSGSPMLTDYYYPPTSRNPSISIRRLGQPDSPLTLLHPWHPLRKKPDKTAPALHSLGMRGSFALKYQKENGRNLLTVTCEAPGKKGEKVCQLGFTANKKGVTIPLQAGNLIYLAVELEFPAKVAQETNYIFIQDFNGTWERRMTPAPTVKGAVTSIVSKRIRKGSTRLYLGVMFQPTRTHQQLKIKDMKILIKQTATL